jgi:hypothetical protein
MAKNWEWKSKIVGHDRVPAGQLLANPFNHRRHPQQQRDVVEGSIRELGFLKSVIVNKTTGHVIDGHERIMQALQHGENVLVDVEFVALSPEQEKLALLVLDKSSELATVDANAFEMLLRDVQTGEQAIADLLDTWSQKVGVLNESESPSEIIDKDAGDPPPSGVRMVQLFLDESNIAEFQDACTALAEAYSTANITDTVLEAVKRASASL